MCPTLILSLNLHNKTISIAPFVRENWGSGRGRGWSRAMRLGLEAYRIPRLRFLMASLHEAPSVDCLKARPLQKYFCNSHSANTSKWTELQARRLPSVSFFGLGLQNWLRLKGPLWQILCCPSWLTPLHGDPRFSWTSCLSGIRNASLGLSLSIWTPITSLLCLLVSDPGFSQLAGSILKCSSHSCCQTLGCLSICYELNCVLPKFIVEVLISSSSKCALI